MRATCSHESVTFGPKSHVCLIPAGTVTSERCDVVFLQPDMLTSLSHHYSSVAGSGGQLTEETEVGTFNSTVER